MGRNSSVEFWNGTVKCFRAPTVWHAKTVKCISPKNFEILKKFRESEGNILLLHWVYLFVKCLTKKSLAVASPLQSAPAKNHILKSPEKVSWNWINDNVSISLLSCWFAGQAVRQFLKPSFKLKQYLKVRNVKCEAERNDKNFVKVTLLLKKLLNSWFHE